MRLKATQPDPSKLSASQINEKLQLSGTTKLVNLFTMQLYGPIPDTNISYGNSNLVWVQTSSKISVVYHFQHIPQLASFCG